MIFLRWKSAACIRKTLHDFATRTRLSSTHSLAAMLVCIVGPPQAGKKSLADHLVRDHAFARVHLVSSLPTSRSQDDLYFTSSSDFLDHATRTWRRNFVTVDLVSKAKLAEFVKRPFVAVVAVDAPLGVRFRRAVAVCVPSQLCSASGKLITLALQR